MAGDDVVIMKSGGPVVGLASLPESTAMGVQRLN